MKEKDQVGEEILLVSVNWTLVVWNNFCFQSSDAIVMLME